MGKNQRSGSSVALLIKRLKPGDCVLIEDNDRLSRQDWLTASNLVDEITSRGAIVVDLSTGNEITHERFRKDPGCVFCWLPKQFIAKGELTENPTTLRSLGHCAKPTWPPPE